MPYDNAKNLGKGCNSMPKKSKSYIQPFSKEDGTALVRAIRQYASRFPRQKEVSATFEEMEAFDTADELDFGGGEDGPNGRMPRPDTLRNWIEGSTTAMQAAHGRFVENFLRKRAPHLLPIRIDDVRRIKQLVRFFGEDETLIRSVGLALQGRWLMYRKWRIGLSYYLVSPVDITFSASENVITATDELHYEMPGPTRDMVEQIWDGFIVPQGRFLNLIFRVVTESHAQTTNVKFVLINEMIRARERGSQEGARLHMLIGQTLIGVEEGGNSSAFATVLERVDAVEDDMIGRKHFSELPRSVRESFLKREDEALSEVRLSRRLRDRLDR